jgi:hypothetical protein
MVPNEIFISTCIEKTKTFKEEGDTVISTDRNVLSNYITNLTKFNDEECAFEFSEIMSVRCTRSEFKKIPFTTSGMHNERNPSKFKFLSSLKMKGSL